MIPVTGGKINPPKKTVIHPKKAKTCRFYTNGIGKANVTAINPAIH